MKNKKQTVTGNINISEDTFENAKLGKPTHTASKEILKLLKLRKWQGVTFKKGRGKIGFYPEIEMNPKSAKDWSLNILAIPDLKKQDHEHFMMSYQEIRKIHRFLGKMLGHIDKLKNKNLKKNAR